MGWRSLLERAMRGIDALEKRGTPLKFHTFGGGTALMTQFEHRYSKDIDLFIPDPQYLALLSPRLGGEEIWGCGNYDEAAHYLKIRYEEGEIDFIVSDRLTEIPLLDYPFREWMVPMEHPVEIAIKKLHYRAMGLKPRDIFDVAVIMTRDEDLLRENLHVLSEDKEALTKRLRTLDPNYHMRNLKDLEILPAWEHIKPLALEMVEELINKIPSRRPD